MKTTNYQWPIWLALPLFLSSTAAFSLHEAILNKNVQQAIKEIPLSSKDKLSDSESALHLATEQELIPVVKMLLLYGYDINAISPQGETATDIALELKNMELLKLLATNNGYLHKHNTTDLRAFILLEQILKSSSGREIFPFICPLFFMDIGVFKTLRIFLQDRKTNIWIIEDVLGSFAAERFPSGHPAPEAIAELKLLLQEINASEHLRRRIYTALEDRPYENLQINYTPSPLLEEKSIYQMASLDIVKLARALTLRESRIFKALTTWNFVDFMYETGTQSAIYKYLTFSATNSAAIIHYFKKYYTQENKYGDVKKILKLGKEFLKLNNFSGLTMAVTALSELQSTELVTLKKNDRIIFEKLNRIISPHNNYEEYYKYLLNLALQEPFVPILQTYLSNLKNYYEMHTQLINLDLINNIGLVLHDLNSIKRRQDYKFNNPDKLDNFLDKTPFNYGAIKKQ
jgi:hypothetical protein